MISSSSVGTAVNSVNCAPYSSSSSFWLPYCGRGDRKSFADLVADFPGRNECLKVHASFHLKLSYWLQLCRLYLSQRRWHFQYLAHSGCQAMCSSSSPTAVRLSVNRIKTDSWKERRLFLSSAASVDTINDQVIRRLVDNGFRSIGLTCLFLTQRERLRLSFSESLNDKRPLSRTPEAADCLPEDVQSNQMDQLFF